MSWLSEKNIKILCFPVLFVLAAWTAFELVYSLRYYVGLNNYTDRKLSVYEDEVAVFASAEDCFYRKSKNSQKIIVKPPAHFSIAGYSSNYKCYQINMRDGIAGWVEPVFSSTQFQRYDSADESPRKPWIKQLNRKAIRLSGTGARAVYGDLQSCLACEEAMSKDFLCGQRLVGTLSPGDSVTVSEKFYRVEDGMPCLHVELDTDEGGWMLGLGEDR